MSIYTCGELGRCQIDRLTKRFGIIGPRLKLMGQGAYSDESDRSSVLKATTIPA